MLSNFNHLKHNILLLLILFSIVSFSCVYFNTFYNAETSFKKAMKIIEESPILDTDELPSQSKKLLGEAIENSHQTRKSSYLRAHKELAKKMVVSKCATPAQRGFKVVSDRLNHSKCSNYRLLVEISQDFSKIV